MQCIYGKELRFNVLWCVTFQFRQEVFDVYKHLRRMALELENKQEEITEEVTHPSDLKAGDLIGCLDELKVIMKELVARHAQVGSPWNHIRKNHLFLIFDIDQLIFYVISSQFSKDDYIYLYSVLVFFISFTRGTCIVIRVSWGG